MAARANGTGERGGVNRYLTDLAVRWRKWEIPVGVMSALFGSHGAFKLWTDRRQNNHTDRDDPDQ